MSRILRPSLKNLVGSKDLVGVEIGVFLGTNTKTIFENLDIRKLYLVDPYNEDSSIFQNTQYRAFIIEYQAHVNLELYEDKIVWVKDISDNIIYYFEDDFDFVYVDGDHKYEGVIRDLNIFYKLIKSGGIIGGHDFDAETEGNQVRKAVYDFFAPLRKEIHFDFDPDDNKTLDWWVFK